MTRLFKVPVNVTALSIDQKTVGALADTGTSADLGTASRGNATQAARSDHAHRTVVVYSGSTPSSTDVIWVDTLGTASNYTISPFLLMGA